MGNIEVIRVLRGFIEDLLEILQDNAEAAEIEKEYREFIQNEVEENDD